MLVGLAAKNGILIVEFTNQLRDKGITFDEAIITSAGQRLRPIIMTAITTAFGALPLVMSSGAGAETRTVIGIVVLTGIVAATFFTLTIVPIMYHLLAKQTSSPKQLEMRLEQEMKKSSIRD